MKLKSTTNRKFKKEIFIFSRERVDFMNKLEKSNLKN